MAMFWNCEILESHITSPQQKIMGNITSNQRENKTVDRISLLNLSWYQRNYSIFVTFRNSVAVRVYQNDVDLLFFLQYYDTRDYRTEFVRTTVFFFVFSKGRSCMFQIVQMQFFILRVFTSVKENWLTF